MRPWHREASTWRSWFSRIADEYDLYRPSLPPAVLDHLDAAVPNTGIETVLEVGCGTGQATRGLAERWHSVIGVEPARGMAELARRNLKHLTNVSIRGCKFEDVELSGETPKVIFAANSWHWVDPEVGYRKAYELLEPDGSLAIAANLVVGYDPPIFLEMANHAISDLNLPSARFLSPGSTDDREPWMVDLLEQSGLFSQIETATFRLSTDMSAERFIRSLNTNRGLTPAQGAVDAAIRGVIESEFPAGVTQHEDLLFCIARRGQLN